MKTDFFAAVGAVAVLPFALGAAENAETKNAETNRVADLGTVTVEAGALSKYRPETVTGGTFTGEPPETLPCVVDTLTEDFIREKNPTDMNDLLRQVPGIETGGTSLLVRQPGLFKIRGLSGTEPAFDGVIPVGRGSGLFMDPSMMERVEVVKGPIASLAGGAGAQQNANGAGGSINMYLKGAHFRDSEVNFSEQTSAGRNVWHQRGLVDANEVLVDDALAVRLPVAFDYYSPAYVSRGSQRNARPREQWTAAPSLLFRPTDALTLGVKTMFVSSDSPSYIGIPVWNGKPGGGYGWFESSCRNYDRSTYKGMMIHPYADWQVTDDWLLKLGGAFMYSHVEQTTREPYAEYSGTGFDHYCLTGQWLGNASPYQETSFSESRWFQRSFNLYLRSVYEKKELPGGFRNTLMVQPDFYYRDTSGAFGTPTSRYGVTVQDALGWGWVTVLAGLRADYFVENDSEGTLTVTQGRTRKTVDLHYPEQTATALSPRAGLTVRPLDWLVFFGNYSETRTPTLGYCTLDGQRPSDPWVARQWEGGVRVRPLEKLWLSASYFDVRQENMPTLNADGWSYYFSGRNSSQGVELSLSGDITKNWTAMAMYAYTFYVDHEETGKASEFEQTPRNTFTFNTSYRLHGFDLVEDVVVGMGYRYRSMSYATMRGSFVHENLRFDSSHVFDVNVSVPLSKFGWRDDWFVTLGVRNLFDERYFDTSRHYYECFAGDPRTFEIGLRGKF